MLPKAERLVLAALAQHGTLASTQAAILTGYSHKSGGFRNALSSLRTAGRIIGPGSAMTATEAGLADLGPVEPLPTGADLRRWWQERHLGKAERLIVDVLAGRPGEQVPVTEIAAATGYSASSGGFRNALSRLRSLRLATTGTPGTLRLSPDLDGA